MARTRKVFGTRKVGHAGTLDPMATGLMLLGVGDATRLLAYFVGEDKTYEATVRFGRTTTTEDADGEPTSAAAPEALARIDEAAIRSAAERFVGEIEQVPSAVSAIKVDGRRAHERVRAGEEVVLEARPVTIHGLTVHGAEALPAADGPVVDARITVRCSSGTYIRALARDIGEALGVGAHLTALHRTRIGGFGIEDAATLPERAEIEAGAAAPALIDPAEAMRRRFPAILATPDEARALRHGRRIPAAEFADRLEEPPSGPIAMLDPDGSLIGLVELRDGATKTLMNMPERAPGTDPR
ncbi:tRNA pseudouridine synthase B [Gulosibacter sp. 10]|nr:tRNA pseudouridine synthase B [Gulosibacter sp. 10]